MVEEATSRRFHAKVRKTAGCWVWTASKNREGYGHFRLGEHMRLAHRVSWFLLRGPIPDGMNVLHKCDNPSCVRLSHLFLGRHIDNMTDMKTKGRARGHRGDSNGRSKLCDQDIRRILQLKNAGRTNVEIAKMFKVANQLISRICLKQCWNTSRDSD